MVNFSAFRSQFVLIVMLAASMSVVHADISLIRDNKPVAKIFWTRPIAAPVNPRKPKDTLEPPLAVAVRELSYHLQKMSGATLEVVETTDATTVHGPAIVLGDLAAKLGAAPQKSSLSKEGFRLLTKGDLLLIGGESDDAVLFGAYSLLEKLGCDWVMPGEIGEVIPQRATVSVPNLDEAQAPDFAFRNLWYRGYGAPRLPAEAERFAQWRRRQKSGSFTHPAGETSGHIWDQFIKKHKAEFDKDPTMYALRRGPDGTLQRLGPQLESTHPRVIELFVQDIKDTFAKNNWPKNKAAGFGIGPADGLGYSVSAESTLAGSGRIDPIIGEPDRTDLVVLLGNTILEKLCNEYPNVYVGFYSYSVHEDYPLRYKPHPRMVAIFAPINFSRFHSLLDENSKSQAYYKSVVEQWGKLAKAQGNPLIYRGYNWNLAENMLPYTKLKIWGEELPFYKKLGILGMNIEATKAWAINGPSDYLYMKLAWNTAQDWRQVLKTYCQKSFGDGAAPMERYFLRLVDTQHGAGEEAGSYHAFPLIYNDAFIAEAEKDFAAAQLAAKLPQEKTRIDYIASGVEMLKLYFKYRQATLDFNFVAAKQAYDDLQAFWKEIYNQDTDVVANEAPAYMKRFLTPFVEGALKYSTGDYRLIERLPDELPTLFDPTNTGDSMRYPSPAINDSGYIKTKSYSTTWDAQGLAGLRGGSVWYRHHFKLPAEQKGKSIGLFLGGFDDEARVWINGQLVGTSGRQFSKPAVYDLTDGIKYEGDNVVAIQIVRNSLANELGTGGLIRPSYIFTGPRLETRAPKVLEQKRVLPGGEEGAAEG